MTVPSARLVAGSQDWALGGEPQIVPAGPLVMAIKGARGRTVTLDGRPVRLSAGTEGLIGVDLARSTGYHRVEIDGATYWFGTEDSKLRLAGIEAMLNELRGTGTGWTGQMLFSDGTGLRDPHVLYGWLDASADDALSALAAILASPRQVTQAERALSRRAGAGIVRAPTLRLLRSSPRENLAPNPRGVLKIGESRYDPLRVVVRKRRNTVDTIANRRAVGLLAWLVRLIEEVIASSPSQTVVTRCRLWLNRTQTLARRPLAQTLRTLGPAPVLPRQPEEATEHRYRLTYALALDIRRLFGWSATTQPLSRYSYVNYADEIYQAYAASHLAQQLGLTQTDPVLGTVPLAFTGPNFDLYYDTKCPPDVLRSWRASSHRPDDSRPDLLLHERSTGRVAVLDAKYRVSPDGGASEDSRKDVSAYLGLYGLDTVSILYPGSAALTQLSGRGRSIIEIPLRPPAGDLAAAASLILESLAVPPY
ncbi:hypothetical protein [Mycobacterium colombiense]|uniref:hypothetical protein n=1 Tax=Mycobacterium colombiense TaxID=339268 RepID=UPI001151539F|nr:hypothetical protein [Mycobacterium colombiense]